MYELRNAGLRKQETGFKCLSVIRRLMTPLLLIPRVIRCRLQIGDVPVTTPNINITLTPPDGRVMLTLDVVTGTGWNITRTMNMSFDIFRVPGLVGIIFQLCNLYNMSFDIFWVPRLVGIIFQLCNLYNMSFDIFWVPGLWTWVLTFSGYQD